MTETYMGPDELPTESDSRLIDVERRETASLEWEDVLRASLDTSLAFLAEEPDLYTDEDDSGGADDR